MTPVLLLYILAPSSYRQLIVLYNYVTRHIQAICYTNNGSRDLSIHKEKQLRCDSNTGQDQVRGTFGDPSMVLATRWSSSLRPLVHCCPMPAQSM